MTARHVMRLTRKPGQEVVLTIDGMLARYVTGKFTPDPTGVVSCGFTCHTRVAAKDYIFTAYGTR